MLRRPRPNPSSLFPSIRLQLLMHPKGYLWVGFPNSKALRTVRITAGNDRSMKAFRRIMSRKVLPTTGRSRPRVEGVEAAGGIGWGETAVRLRGNIRRKRRRGSL